MHPPDPRCAPLGVLLVCCLLSGCALPDPTPGRLCDRGGWLSADSVAEAPEGAVVVNATDERIAGSEPVVDAVREAAASGTASQKLGSRRACRVRDRLDSIRNDRSDSAVYVRYDGEIVRVPLALNT